MIVLGTGRCGTVTFIEACRHIDNFTAGHETRSGLIGPEQIPLSRSAHRGRQSALRPLGGLGRALDDETTLYAHLTRDPALVAASFRRRWTSTYRASIILAFGHGIVSRTDDSDSEEIGRVCDFYVETVTANISAFVVGGRWPCSWSV